MVSQMQNYLYPAIDSHVDLLYDLIRRHPDVPLRDLPDAWVSLPKLSAGNVRVIVSAFFCKDAYNGSRAADNLRSLFYYSDRICGGLTPVSNAEQLAASYSGTKGPCALFLLENADALVEFPPEALLKRGFRVVGLTHFGANRLADGNAVPRPAGLTSIGRKLVRDLDRLGFAIDSAHLPDPGFWDVAEIFSGPIISTHTGLRAFHDVPRNLSEDQIRTILSHGGIVGIAACPGILSADEKADITLLFRHIDWVVQRFGPEGVGIGSDLGGYSTVCKGFEDHTRFPDLAFLMEKAGYPETAIAGIMGGNWFRFFSRLLSATGDD